jgi:hypothetical protein
VAQREEWFAARMRTLVQRALVLVAIALVTGVAAWAANRPSGGTATPTSDVTPVRQFAPPFENHGGPFGDRHRR